MKRRSEHYEKEFDDEVYEDEFYEENLDEEELSDEDEFKEEDEFDEDSEEGGRTYTVSYACEECDYRWDEPFVSSGEYDDEEDEHEVTCPMCGSAQVDPL